MNTTQTRNLECGHTVVRQTNVRLNGVGQQILCPECMKFRAITAESDR